MSHSLRGSRPARTCIFSPVSRGSGCWQKTRSGTDGKTLKSKQYDWLTTVPTVELKSDFVTIPPGGVRFIGPRGKLTGMMFLSSSRQPAQFEDVAPIGRNRITISYTNNDNGRK